MFWPRVPVAPLLRVAHFKEPIWPQRHDPVNHQLLIAHEDNNVPYRKSLGLGGSHPNTVIFFKEWNHRMAGNLDADGLIGQPSIQWHHWNRPRASAWRWHLLAC
jgi:hypothetical protein